MISANKFATIFGYLAIIAPYLSFSQQIQSAVPDPTEPRLSLRLDEPKQKPLRKEVILEMFSDKIMSVDINYEPTPGTKVNQIFFGGCAPTEEFHSNGEWKLRICQVMARTISGHWYIEEYRSGQRLCVYSKDYNKDCRTVWIGPEPNQVIMTDNSFGGDRGWNKVYTLYRLDNIPTQR